MLNKIYIIYIYISVVNFNLTDNNLGYKIKKNIIFTINVRSPVTNKNA
jgi:hypothetical protein